MLRNNRGRDYDVYEGGERALSVRYLTPTEPSDCCMCGRSTFDHFAVPYYCGPVRSGKSEGGYAPACRRCYDRWARWDDAMEEYDSWLALLRAAMSPHGDGVNYTRAEGGEDGGSVPTGYLAHRVSDAGGADKWLADPANKPTPPVGVPAAPGGGWEPDAWAAYIAGVLVSYLSSENAARESDRREAAIAGIIRRRIHWLMPARGVPGTQGGTDA